MFLSSSIRFSVCRAALLWSPARDVLRPERSPASAASPAPNPTPRAAPRRRFLRPAQPYDRLTSGVPCTHMLGQSDNWLPWAETSTPEARITFAMLHLVRLNHPVQKTATRKFDPDHPSRPLPTRWLPMALPGAIWRSPYTNDHDQTHATLPQDASGHAGQPRAASELARAIAARPCAGPGMLRAPKVAGGAVSEPRWVRTGSVEVKLGCSHPPSTTGDRLCDSVRAIKTLDFSTSL